METEKALEGFYISNINNKMIDKAVQKYSKFLLNFVF